MNGPFFRLPRPLRALLWLSLIGAAPSAQALCVQGLCSCTVTTTSVLFANYNPLAYGNTDSTGTVTVKCGGVAGLLIPFTIAFDKGGGPSISSRRLAFGANALSYNLYIDNTYTTVWGDGTTGTMVAGGLLLDALGLSPGLVYTVYGRIPGRQTTVPPGGPYIDAVSVTLTYQ